MRTTRALWRSHAATHIWFLKNNTLKHCMQGFFSSVDQRVVVNVLLDRFESEVIVHISLILSTDEVIIEEYSTLAISESAGEDWDEYADFGDDLGDNSETEPLERTSRRRLNMRSHPKKRHCSTRTGAYFFWATFLSGCRDLRDSEHRLFPLGSSKSRV